MAQEGDQRATFYRWKNKAQRGGASRLRPRSGSWRWEETVQQDTGLLGFSTKHICSSGPKKKFRVRYDRTLDFEPFSDGLGLMRNAQTAKPQSFRAGDGWFAYNLPVNLDLRKPYCRTPETPVPASIPVKNH